MNLTELAQRIKAKRLQRRMTLEELAKASGLTHSWLSKVENFRITPSLPALIQLSKALGVSIAELVTGLDAEPDLCLVKADERKVIERDRPYSSIVYESLAYKRPERVMDPFVLTIPPGVARKEALPHEGEEFLYVLHGKITLEYGSKSYDMEAGDSAYFNATVKHRVINRSRKDSQVLCVFYQ